MIRLADLSLRFAKKTPMTATQRSGLNYEQRVSKWLEQEYNFYPQLEFETPRGVRIPDGLLFHPKGLIVVEIKTQHVEPAARQLGEYVDMVSSWAKRPVYGLEICEALRLDILGYFKTETYRWVRSIDEVFDSYSQLTIMPMLRFRLPRLREAAEVDGRGDDTGYPDFAVRAGGSARDSAISLQCCSDVVAAEGARGARGD